MSNLATIIEQQLPPELVSLLHTAGEAAHQRGESLYLVGGAVRDLLLGQNNLDLDLVVKGSAIDLAQRLAPASPAKLTTHPRFNTAKIQWGRWSVDIATARSESYARPGALPDVQPGSLKSDLFRRDFTINAMAIRLNPGHYGRLIDLYGGRDDLGNKLLRILHQKSFTDDATRILRGLRYEQRLGFRMERHTLWLLKRDIAMLDTISGDRLRHELELILKEEHPERVLRRAGELDVLRPLHPALKGNGWLEDRFEQARRLTAPSPPPVGLYLALLAYPLAGDECEQLISRLRLPKSPAQALRDTHSLKDKLPALADPELPPSHVHRLLHGHSPLAITANMLASDSHIARKHIRLFRDKLRYVKPALTGAHLLRIGVPSGPHVKEVLQQLLEARLDGAVASQWEEEIAVVRWLDRQGVR